MFFEPGVGHVVELARLALPSAEVGDWSSGANRPLYRVSYTPVTGFVHGKKSSTSYGVRTHASFETGA